MNGTKSGGGLEINKVDSNELLRQAGIFEGLKDVAKSGTKPVAPANQTNIPTPK